MTILISLLLDFTDELVDTKLIDKGMIALYSVRINIK